MPRVELNSVEEFQTHVMEFFNTDEEIKCEQVEAGRTPYVTNYYYKTTSSIGGWVVLYDTTFQTFSVHRARDLWGADSSCCAQDLATAVRSCCMKMDRKIFEAAQSIAAMTTTLSGLLARGKDCTIRDP